MRCADFEEISVSALYGDLSGDDRRAFESHLADCEACAAAYAEMRETVDYMDRRRVDDPGNAYWEEYYGRLAGRMGIDASPEPGGAKTAGWLARLGAALDRLLPRARWAYQLAGAAALVVIGVFVGRAFFPATGVPEQASTPVAQQAVPDASVGNRPGAIDRAGDARGGKSDDGAVQMVSTQQRTEDYLEGTQMLLMSLVNADPDEGMVSAGTLAAQKRRSEALLADAAVLKNELHSARQHRLRELVTELELILIQIANLEFEGDMSEVEFIRSRVDRNGVLLKINLEQLRGSYDGERQGKGKTNGPRQSTHNQRSI